MSNYIGENIKRLRLHKNITQEKLAEHMSVSTQAVSKWERCETYPDISMIVPLASYFGITTDELLGFDEAKNQAVISKYLEDYAELKREAKWTESVNLITKAHKEFPNNFLITIRYLYDIIGSMADNPKELVIEKADELTVECQRIIDECTVDEIRNGAIDILAKVEKAKGNTEKALELLSRFPDWFGCTRYQKAEQLFDKKSSEWWYYLNYNFYMLCDFSINKLLKMIWYDEKSFDEKVKSTLKIAEWLKEILKQTNYEMLYRSLETIYDHIGGQYHFANRDIEGIPYFELALNFAQKLDEFILSDRQIPNTHYKLKIDISTNIGMSVPWGFVKRMIEWYGKGEWYAELRKTKEFNALLDKYRPYSKDLV